MKVFQRAPALTSRHESAKCNRSAGSSDRFYTPIGRYGCGDGFPPAAIRIRSHPRVRSDLPRSNIVADYHLIDPVCTDELPFSFSSIPLIVYYRGCVRVQAVACVNRGCVIAAQSSPSSINELASIYLLLHHWNPCFPLCAFAIYLGR